MTLTFKSKLNQAVIKTDEEVRKEILRRAEINTEARKMAEKIMNGKVHVVTNVVTSSNTLETLDKVLDAVSKYDNIKISTLCELYNALESGDTKNLIEFLKKKDKNVVVKKRKLKATWEL